eukprot:TRINITY_DN48889_c0_g1_i1.p1 TRINITY_DN48889_c0_g1~~TRINITY_DN48889_c0_g1_i1.p1  ORF type:complete len:838 (-),score=113.46 TRINITY_DN48889_c0_g1_i1:357-2870(-)
MGAIGSRQEPAVGSVDGMRHFNRPTSEAEAASQEICTQRLEKHSTSTTDVAMHIYNQKSQFQQQWLCSQLPQSLRPTLLTCTSAALHYPQCSTRHVQPATATPSCKSLARGVDAAVEGSLLPQALTLDQTSWPESGSWATSAFASRGWCCTSDGEVTACRDHELCFMATSEFQPVEVSTSTSSNSVPGGRHCWRSSTVPVLTKLPKHSGPARVRRDDIGTPIEMLYVVGSFVGSSTDPEQEQPLVGSKTEPHVLLRYPEQLYEHDPEAANRLALIDARITSFCFPTGSSGRGPEPSSSSAFWHTPPRVPFAFTVLASVLPQVQADDDLLSEQVAGVSSSGPDPTELLYCTAVCFDEQIPLSDKDEEDKEETFIAPYAICIISRHPFVADFGDLLLALNDGEELSSNVGADKLRGESCFDSNCAVGNNDTWRDLAGRLSRAASLLKSSGPPAVPRLENAWSRRSRTAPSSAVSGIQNAYTVRESDNQGNESCGGSDDDTEVVSTNSRALLSKTKQLMRQTCWEKREKCIWSPACFRYHAPRSLLPCPPWASEWTRLRSHALMDWAAVPLFRQLDVDVVMQILTALLLELRVIIVSRSVDLASAIVLGLSSLLWPFSWQHLLLPVCPSSLQEAIIDAPVPLLCALPFTLPQSAGKLQPNDEYGSGSPFTALSKAFGKCGHSGILRLASVRHDVVICNVDANTISIPPEYHELLKPGSQPSCLRQRTAPMAEQQQRLRRMLSLELISKQIATSEAQSATVDLRMQVQAGMVDLAQSILDASESAPTELGAYSWIRHMEGMLIDRGHLLEAQFHKLFINTHTCLMFLAVCSQLKESDEHED